MKRDTMTVDIYNIYIFIIYIYIKKENEKLSV